MHIPWDCVSRGKDQGVQLSLKLDEQFKAKGTELY